MNFLQSLGSAFTGVSSLEQTAAADVQQAELAIAGMFVVLAFELAIVILLLVLIARRVA